MYLTVLEWGDYGSSYVQPDNSINHFQFARQFIKRKHLKQSTLILSNLKFSVS